MVPTPVCFLVVRLTIANHFSDSGMMLYIPFHFLKTQCHPCPDGMKRSLQLRVKMWDWDVYRSACVSIPQELLGVHGPPDAVTRASPALLEGRAHVGTPWPLSRGAGTPRVGLAPGTPWFLQLPAVLRLLAAGLECPRGVEAVDRMIWELKQFIQFQVCDAALLTTLGGLGKEDAKCHKRSQTSPSETRGPRETAWPRATGCGDGASPGLASRLCVTFQCQLKLGAC